MPEVRDERARPLHAPQQPMRDQIPDGALHRQSGHPVLLGELVFGRNPVLGLKIARMNLMQELVLDLQISRLRLSHCLVRVLCVMSLCEVRLTCKYKSGTLTFKAKLTGRQCR